jgi:DNA-binding CsgD family transcriptional regulator
VLTVIRYFRRRSKQMNAYGLSLREIGTLILISEGKSIGEIVEHAYPSIDKFDAAIRNIMDKTNANTWEELKAIGAQIAHISKSPSTVIEPIQVANTYDDLLKEHIEAFCDLYDLWIKDHTIACKSCYVAFNGYEFICHEHRSLLNNKKDWMDKLITKL